MNAYQMVTAIILLIGAIVVLSLGTQRAKQSVRDISATSLTEQPQLIVIGVLGLCVAGFSYFIFGPITRYTISYGTHETVVLLLASSVGLLGLGFFTHKRIGLDMALATPVRDLTCIDLFNVVAFWALTRMLRHIGLVYVNALNAGQTTMAAVVGVTTFHEPLTLPLISGVGLTILGLTIMS